ncbi:MAG TPA: DUF2203 domain-containing protein [Candidatus Limnocylindrales bacterium]|jgi:hypothetical protein
MARFYDLDDANARIPELRDILGSLRDQRADLIRLRDLVLERQEAVEAGGGSGRGGDAEDEAEAEAELRLIRLRMQGIIDQMQAAVARIDALGITLRDIESGLIDFPALVNGRQVCLCWRLGEGDVEWWHELNDGFAGRRPLIELV